MRFRNFVLILRDEYIGPHVCVQLSQQYSIKKFKRLESAPITATVWNYIRTHDYNTRAWFYNPSTCTFLSPTTLSDWLKPNSRPNRYNHGWDFGAIAYISVLRLFFFSHKFYRQMHFQGAFRRRYGVFSDTRPLVAIFLCSGRKTATAGGSPRPERSRAKRFREKKFKMYCFDFDSGTDDRDVDEKKFSWTAWNTIWKTVPSKVEHGPSFVEFRQRPLRGQFYLRPV